MSVTSARVIFSSRSAGRVVRPSPLPVPKSTTKPSEGITASSTSRKRKQVEGNGTSRGKRNVRVSSRADAVQAEAVVAELTTSTLGTETSNTTLERMHSSHLELQECARAHGIVAERVRVESICPTDSSARIALLSRMSTEFAEANRPLIGVNIYQQELASTLSFSGAGDPRSVTAAALPEISLAMEMQFMCEADVMQGHRPCRMGSKCDTRRVCSMVGITPWTMREFLMPAEQDLLLQAGELPLQPGMCVFCRKKNTMMHLGTQMLIDQDARVIIQPYRNKYDSVGEFAQSMMILPRPGRFHGIVAPFARHDTSMYTIEIDKATGLAFAAYTDEVYFHLAPVEHA